MKPLTIKFKPGPESDEAAEAILKRLDDLDRERMWNPRILATGIAEDKGRTITVQFDDALDYLAFLCAIGAVHAEGIKANSIDG